MEESERPKAGAWVDARCIARWMVSRIEGADSNGSADRGIGRRFYFGRRTAVAARLPLKQADVVYGHSPINSGDSARRAHRRSSSAGVEVLEMILSGR